MPKLVRRKHQTLFVECSMCLTLLECSPKEILNKGSDDWDWDHYALKGRCPCCHTFNRPNFYISKRHFYADLVGVVKGEDSNGVLRNGS